MKEVWKLRNKTADFDGICKRFGIGLPLARLIVNRGYDSFEQIEEYLYPRLTGIPPHSLLKDINKAVALISKAIDNGSYIRIVGDYDVDGVTSTYLLLTAFEELGAYVTYRIPDRVTDGYGISRNIIEEAIADGIDLIVTCDNGIAAKSQIEYAKEQGITVIVTDHHDIPEELPPADCIINPKQKDCEYPNKGICGAMVAAKLCEALYEKYGFGGFVEKHLDILALATVCDVMELTGENRVVVKLGLEELNKRTNLGLAQLGNVSGLGEKTISAYHLGFVLGPCLNATGRLETAEAGVELLRAKNDSEALYLANRLKELNEIRKEKTVKGIDKAIDIIEYSEQKKDNVLLVYLSNCHESLAGIIAGKLKERYNKPTLVFTDSNHDDQILKGSGRSVDGYNMFEELCRCSEHILKFGGHPMAAGLTIERTELDKLRAELNRNCDVELLNSPKKVLIDIRMPMSVADEKLINELKLLEPTGMGNEKPVFADRNVMVKRASRFGKEAKFLRLDMIDSAGIPINAKLFNGGDSFVQEYEEIFGEKELDALFAGKGSKELHFVFYPDINEYNGLRLVQVNINGWMFPEDAVLKAEESRKQQKVSPKDKELKTKQSDSGSYNAKSPESGRCLIFCGGDEQKLWFDIRPEDYVIAADKGYEYAVKLGVEPDLLMGDFDSFVKVDETALKGIKVERFPVEKDDTDTAIAIKRAIELGYKEIYLFGASGGERIDHTLANISLLAYGAERGARVYMFDKKSCLTVIKDNEICFDATCKGDLSVFAYGGIAKGVTEKNLKYELQNAELKPEVSLGVSNSFVGKQASVKAKDGMLLIVGEFLPGQTSIEKAQ